MINIIPHLFSLFASYRSLSKCSIYWNGNVALSSSFKSPEIVGASNSNALTVNANATRVYRPKSSLGDINPKDIKVKSNEPFLLSSPQFLIRFKTPKVKSKLKLQLEELQVCYHRFVMIITTLFNVILLYFRIFTKKTIVLKEITIEIRRKLMTSQYHQ
jgi:hypothetical protein